MLPRRTALLTATMVTGVLAAGLVPTSGAQGAAQKSAQKSAQGKAPAAAAVTPARIKDQALTWKKCFDRQDEPDLPRTYYRQQCATLTVPEDWADPNGATIKIAVSRLPATHRPAKGVLFTNPGGPGAAGADLPLVFGEAGRKALLRGQDVYGMDPRGVGGSDNVTCGEASVVSTDPRLRTADNENLLMDSAAFLAHACDLAGGAYIDHVDTAETVRDLDLLRSLIHAQTINWLGYSAGTWLGAAYSAAFPEHTGRFVFDSTVDFTGTWEDAFELQAQGFQRRFDEDFLPWAAKYNSLFHLGTTPAAVNKTYERVRASLGDSRTDSVPAVLLDQIMAGTMYSAELFPLAASILSDVDLFGGDSVTALRRSIPTTLNSMSHLNPYASDDENAAFLAVTCNDTAWTTSRGQLVATSDRLGADYPLIGWATILQPCSFWAREQRTLPLPVPSGAGVPPSLFVQSEHDPATPIEGARRAATAFAGSRMLVVTKDGDHAIYAGGNACVDRTVETYLNSGTLPDEGATCAGNRLPGPNASSSRAAGMGSASAEAPSSGAVNPLVRLRQVSQVSQVGRLG
jgi:pimeloyl-ACP methyl ester carboxylesterase